MTKINENTLTSLIKAVSILGLIVATIFFIYEVGKLQIPAFKEGQDSAEYLRTVSVEAAANGLSALKAALIALVIAFGADRLSLALDTLKSDRQLKAQIERLSADFYRNTTVQLVGPSDRANVELSAALKRATRVKNTFLNAGGAPRPHSLSEKEILKSYESFLSKSEDVLWQDIVGVNELHSFRHTRLGLTKNGKPRLKADGLPELVGEHQISVLKKSIPIVNFIILSNPSENYSEVYFGWLFDRARAVTNIYKSVQPEIIQIFEKYYDLLWADLSVEDWSVNYRKPPEERGPFHSYVVDKKGIWINMACSHGDWDKINYAAISIDFEENAARIIGSIIDDEKAGSRPIRHTNVVESPNSLYFEYLDSVKEKPMFGFCVYGFERRLGTDSIRGHLLESLHNPRTNLIGVKISGLDPKIDVSDPVQAKRLIDDNLDKLHRLRDEHRAAEQAVAESTRQSAAQADKKAPR